MMFTAPPGADTYRDPNAPLTTVKRVFPPFDPKVADTHVLIQTSAAVGGKGEKYALDSYGPAGNRGIDARIAYDGDGSVTPIAGRVRRRPDLAVGYVPQVETVNWFFPVTVREAE